MQLGMERLNLVAQLQDGFVIGAKVAIDPLPKDAGRGVLASGKLGALIKSVGQVRRPFVVGDLRLQRAVQYGALRFAFGLRPLYLVQPNAVHYGEQHGRANCGGNPYPNILLNTFAHKIRSLPSKICKPKAVGMPLKHLKPGALSKGATVPPGYSPILYYHTFFRRKMQAVFLKKVSQDVEAPQIKPQTLLPA